MSSRYNSGYYYSINSMVACPLIKDLVDKFGGESDTFDAKESVMNATFYFSHSEAVLPFLRLLDLYRSNNSQHLCWAILLGTYNQFLELLSNLAF